MTHRPPRKGSSGTSPEGIHRRDFLNGLLLGAGGLALGSGLFHCGSCRPENGQAPPSIPQGLCDGPIGNDRRALRGANLPSTFNVGHFLRDRRLMFTKNTVEVTPLSSDSVAGSMPLSNDTGTYDVIIVGSGLSGLSSAFFLKRKRPDLTILLLDGNTMFGGNAGRDDAEPLPFPASTGGAYGVFPYAEFLTDFYRTVGLDWEAYRIPEPFYSYFFDDHTPGVLPGRRGWNLDTYGKGMRDVPYAPTVVADLEKSRKDFLRWYDTAGGPTDPADNADPQYDYLAWMTLDEYLTQTQGYSPILSDFYTRYTIDALGSTAKQVNAFSAISFIGSEYNPLFAPPGGTSGIARHILKWLLPEAIFGRTSDEIIKNRIDEEKLDDPNQKIRLRQGAMALRVDNTTEGVRVVYHRDGRFFQAQAKAAILAGQRHTTRHLVDHLLDETTKDAFGQMIQVPVVVANVLLKSAKALVDLGLGYNAYWWGSKYWADFVIGDHGSFARTDPNRKTVLSFYGGNLAPPEEMPAERIKLLQTPFSDYEASLREDLNRVLEGAKFDFDRDVSAVFLYRWGHGMMFPSKGTPFGAPQKVNGKVVRTNAPRHLVRRQLGRISIGGQDTESSPSVESAIASGLRTANEILAVL